MRLLGIDLSRIGVCVLVRRGNKVMSKSRKALVFGSSLDLNRLDAGGYFDVVFVSKSKLSVNPCLGLGKGGFWVAISAAN